MADDADFVEELLNMAKQPDSFSKFELGEIILVAATEIIRLREQYPIAQAKVRRLPVADFPLPHSVEHDGAAHHSPG